MKLVKAKLKSEDQFPKCCDEYLKQHKLEHQKEPVRTLDLDIADHQEMFCSYCGAYLGMLHGVWDVGFGSYTPIHIYDIDEGAYGAN